MVPVITLSSSTTIRITEGTDGVYVVRRCVIQVKGASWTGSFVLKQLMSGSGLTSTDAKNIPYTDRSTGAVAAGGTAISADGIYEVDANGVDIYVVHTQVAGSVSLYVNPMAG